MLLIFIPSIAKLVLFEFGLMKVADLAKWSAVSFPRMSLCPGTQWMVIFAPLWVADRAALIARIWHSCPGLSARKVLYLQIYKRERLLGKLQI
jgi:hypothetical protein